MEGVGGEVHSLQELGLWQGQTSQKGSRLKEDLLKFHQI